MSEPNSRIVAIDTNVLVWGVRKKGPADKMLYAGYLFDELSQDEAQIIIPSIVAAEFITDIPPDARAKVIAELSVRFRIEPFDAKDAILAAELWDIGKAGRQMAQPGARTTLRADTLIVATAKNHGAKEFYSDDGDCRDLASKFMTAKPLPKMA
jgi:predicted nucleic acid-binding protein